MKRSRSFGSQIEADIESEAPAEDDEVNNYNVEEAKGVSLMVPEDGSFENQIFCYLVVSPPGWAISEFRSIKGLLEMFHDAIKGHKSPHQDRKTLHRDVSKNSIIITDAETERDSREMLIDLDLAKELDSSPSGARYQTGTTEFMAIKALKGTGHTYRHNLESFLSFCGRLSVTVRK